MDIDTNESGATNAATAMGGHMSEEVQKQRRNSIRDIMQDSSLTPMEKRRSIQSLMDGRRRSSSGATTRSSSSSIGEMARAAAEAAAYYSSDNEDDQMMDQDVEHIQRQVSQHSLASHGSSGVSAIVDDALTGGGDGERLLHGGKKSRSASLPLWSGHDPALANALAAAQAVADRPPSMSAWDDPMNINRRMEKSRPPCQHYERNCTIISPCCGLAFGCRICHDECPVLPMPIRNQTGVAAAAAAAAVAAADSQQPGGTSDTLPAAQQQQRQPKQEKRRSLPLGWEEEETHHEIDRFAINELICRLCYTRQSSKTNCCISCGTRFGAYHCNVCNLWMSDDESPYHCSDCGFCRVGGRENFRHCDDCGMCIDTLLFDDHNCKAGKYMSNCPVCQEDLFSSRDASHEMPCGHAIHWHCFKELTSYDTRCPVCKKTAETPEHMAPTWQAMAMGIALQPVPPELARVVTIMCNDCEQQDADRRWHFLGVRCLKCMSFNTTVEITTMTGREAASFLDDLDATRGGPPEAAAGMNGGADFGGAVGTDDDPMDAGE